ncbi:hypothetical protein IWX92DRAFT_396868 [Phyllosticta citricarpa]
MMPCSVMAEVGRQIGRKEGRLGWLCLPILSLLGSYVPYTQRRQDRRADEMIPDLTMRRDKSRREAGRHFQPSQAKRAHWRVCGEQQRTASRCVTRFKRPKGRDGVRATCVRNLCAHAPTSASTLRDEREEERKCAHGVTRVAAHTYLGTASTTGQSRKGHCTVDGMAWHGVVACAAGARFAVEQAARVVWMGGCER